MDYKKIFTEIKNTNGWGGTESISGPGSNLNMTSSVRLNLNKIIEKYKIKSILDIPCGDFNWMREVDLSNLVYYGADIVDSLIEENIKKYDGSKIIVY